MENREHSGSSPETKKYQRIPRTERNKMNYNEPSQQNNQTGTTSQVKPAWTPSQPYITDYVQEAKTVPMPRKPKPQVRRVEPLTPKAEKKEKKTLRKRIAALLLAAGVATAVLPQGDNSGSADEKHDENLNKIKIEEVDRASDFRKRIYFPATLREDALEVETTDNTIVQEANKNDLELSMQEVLSMIPNKDNNASVVTNERVFFDRYSSKFNTGIEERNSGPFTSVEEMFDAYKTNPERFAKYALPFMELMELDFIKIKLARQYGNCDFSKIMITYDRIGEASDGTITTVTKHRYPRAGDIYEIRVRHDARGDLECPSFSIRSLTDTEATTIEKIILGTRYSRIDSKYWKDFLTIWELEKYNSSEHDLEQYNAETMSLFLGHSMQMFKELTPEANHYLTWEEDGIER